MFINTQKWSKADIYSVKKKKKKKTLIIVLNN
jgi:hypothetical protein